MRVKDVWKQRISPSVSELIDLDKFADEYLKRINSNKSKMPEGFAIKTARRAMREMLIKKGIPSHEAVHLLHSCGMAVYPRMYAGCGCHKDASVKGGL